MNEIKDKSQGIIAAADSTPGTDLQALPLVDMPLVIYHKGCPDGMLAAWCFWKHFGENAQYHAGVYNEPPPYCFNRNVFLVDFSYPPTIMTMVAEYAANVTVIDHHKAAVDAICALRHENINMWCDYSYSSAALAYSYMADVYGGKKVAPRLINHVQDYDLWKFELAGTREIILSISHITDFRDMEGEVNRCQTAAGREAMVRDGKAIHRYQQGIIRYAVSAHRLINIGGYQVPVANVPGLLANDVCEALHLVSETNTFTASYYDHEKTRNFSLRSLPDGTDVARIARIYGGNGHKHAAGFKIPVPPVV